MNVEELEGEALDAAVAKAAGIKVSMWGDKPCIDGGGGMPGSDVMAWEPSTNWAQGGPIIDHERMNFEPGSDGVVASYGGHAGEFGPTYLIAAMRAFVANWLENVAVQPK